MTSADRFSLVESIVETSANSGRRIEKMAEALQSCYYLDDYEHLSKIPHSMYVLRFVLSRISIRIGAESISRPLSDTAPTPLPSSQWPLDQWQFLSQQAQELIDVAEQALALDFYEIAMQMTIYAIDSLSRILLQAEGFLSIEKKNERREGKNIH